MVWLWAGCFGFTAVVFLLQLFPPVGIFLMFVMAPFWSVLTVNLGFLMMALHGLVVRRARLLLVFPILWFGGYVVAAANSHMEVAELAEEIAVYNEGQLLPFQKGYESLVVEPNAGSVVPASRLVERYTIRAVYNRNGGSNNCSRYRSVSVRSWGCARKRGGSRCPTTVNRISRGYDLPFDQRYVEGVCVASSPARKPPNSPLSVEVTGSEPIESPLLSGEINEIRLRREDGQSITVRAGHARPLTWFPVPVLGCALNSMKAEWECVGRFSRGKTMQLGPDAVTVVANALELKANRLLD